MRKGVAGVRLCDTSGCPKRWPCAAHGTLKAGAELYAGQHGLAARMETQSDCAHGYKACVTCAGMLHQPAQKPEGWYLTDAMPFGELRLAHHPTGASVWALPPHSPEPYHHKFFWAPPGYSECSLANAKDSLEEAKRAALEWKPALRPGHFSGHFGDVTSTTDAVPDFDDE